jgi:uncharacterized protein (TIGR02270 family)
MAGSEMSPISHIVQQHLEEFQFLCDQYQHALQSPEHRLRDLGSLEKRMAAHLDGIIVAGEAALPLLEAGLAADEPQSFAASYALLRMNSAAGRRVLDAFLQAKEGQLEGITRALCNSPLDTMLMNQLRQAVTGSPAAIATAAAEVLAFHRKLGSWDKRLDALLRDDDPAVRRRAWRVMSLSAATAALH